MRAIFFMKKEEWFKDKAFTREVKEMYTKLINNYVKEESEKLSVFQQGGVCPATRKIGRNNPKAEEIRADNAARQDWNRTVESIRQHGWIPDLFRQIVRSAKDFLQEIIFKLTLPSKPVPKIDFQEWKDM